MKSNRIVCAVLCSLALTLFATATARAEDKLTTELYGFVKVDSSWDSSNASPGEYYKSATKGSNDSPNLDQFNLTANQSRVGLNVKGGESEGLKYGGKIEFDFYNPSSTNATQMAPRLRHAFTDMTWADLDLTVMAGQNWDLVSPLNPNNLSTALLNGAGNTGFRRPQLRLTKGFSLSETSKLVTAFEFARQLSNDDQATGVAGSYTQAGNDAEFPGMQARVGYSTTLLSTKPTSFGISAAYGREKFYNFAFNSAGTNPSASFDPKSAVTKRNWMLNFDLTLPLTDELAFTGELFRSENGATYATLDGLTTTANNTGHAIHETGGWLQLQAHPTEKVITNLGYSWDKADNADLVAGNGQLATILFLNAGYNITKALQFALEFSSMHNQFFAQADGFNNRYQATVILTF